MSLSSLYTNSTLSAWAGDVDDAKRLLLDAAADIRSGNLVEYRSKVARAVKTLWLYGYEKSGVTRKTIENLTRVAVTSSNEASFQLNQLLKVADDVCNILAGVSQSASMIYLNDEGALAGNDDRKDMIGRLIDIGFSSTDPGVLSKTDEINDYSKNVLISSPGASDSSSKPLLDPYQVVRDSVKGSGLMYLYDEVSVIRPDAPAMPTIRHGRIAGAAEFQPIDPDGVVDADANVVGGGAFVAHVFVGYDQIRDCAFLFTANSAAGTAQIAINETGLPLDVTATVAVYDGVTVRDDARDVLASTLAGKALASANALLQNDGVYMQGYKAEYKNEVGKPDYYLYSFTLEPGKAVRLAYSNTSTNATEALYYSVSFHSKVQRDTQNAKFIDLVGLQTFASFAQIDVVMSMVNTDVLEEYSSWLEEKYGINKLNGLATTLGVPNWKILFNAAFWSTLGGQTLAQKRTNARLFLRTISIMIRQILSDCEYLRSLTQ